MRSPKNKYIPYIITLLGLLIGLVAYGRPGTMENLISQKILLENTVKQRVSEAIFKVVDNDNFIVDVSVILETKPTTQYKTIYATKEEHLFSEDTRPKEIVQDIDAIKPVAKKSEKKTNPEPAFNNELPTTILKKKQIQTYIPSDIPGFPGLQKPGFEVVEEEVPSEKVQEDVSDKTTNDNTFNPGADIIEEGPETAVTTAKIEYKNEVVPKSVPRLKSHEVETSTVPVFEVKRVNINIILEDQINPNTVESVRTVAMIAAHFDQERGDVLNIMTAPFQGSKKEEIDTEKLILQTISDKISVLEKRQKVNEENETIASLKREQVRIKQEQENKLSLEEEIKKLRKLEQSRIDAQEQELKRIRDAEEERISSERRQLFVERQKQARQKIEADSLRLVALSSQLNDLKDQLASVDIEEEQRLRIELEKKRHEEEQSGLMKSQVDLKEKLRELEARKLQSSSLQPPSDDNNLLWIILGIIALIIATVALIVSLLNKRGAPRDLDDYNGNANDHDIDEAAQLAADRASQETENRMKALLDAQNTALPLDNSRGDSYDMSSDEDVRAEVDEITKSIVSMSVGRPDSASKIIKGWLDDPSTSTETEETATTEKTEEKAEGGE